MHYTVSTCDASMYSMIYIEAGGGSLETILVMTSTEEIAPGVVSHTEAWEIQYYMKDQPKSETTAVLLDANSDSKGVKARHFAVYNNGTTGVSLAEFEVYGTGMDNPDNIAVITKMSDTTARAIHFFEGTQLFHQETSLLLLMVNLKTKCYTFW